MGEKERADMPDKSISELRFENLELDIEERTDGDLFKDLTGQDLKETRSMGGFEAEGVNREKALARAQADVAKLPSLADACSDLIDQIDSENRRIGHIRLSDCRIDSEGSLRSSSSMDNQPIALLEQGFRGLCQRAPKDVPKGLRSNVNSWLGRKSGKANVAKLRILDHAEKGPAAFATISGRYVEFDGDLIAELVARTLPSDCRGSVKYQGDGGRWQITAELARPFCAGTDRASEIHRIALKFRGSDNGTRGVSTSLDAIRQICSNGIKISDRALLKRVRHVGDPLRIVEQITGALQLANEATESFGRRWGLALDNRFTCSETGVFLTANEAIERLVATTINVPHIKPADLTERLLDAHKAEPDPSVAGVLNSITRAAHEGANDWKSVWHQEDLEEMAGDLLYQPVWTLDPLIEV